MKCALHGSPGEEGVRDHLQLLFARLRAAEDALAEEIADNLDVSEHCSLLLARMRIADLAVGRHKTGIELAPGQAGEYYCESCWALLTQETGAQLPRESELFATCVYCGQAVYSDHDWRDAA
jgi:hypothetical protein